MISTHLNGLTGLNDRSEQDSMSDWVTDYLQRRDLEDQLSFCRGKKRELEEHIKYMCEFKDLYDEMFTERLDVARFRAQKYKDEASYEMHATMQKMWSALKYLLDDCK